MTGTEVSRFMNQLYLIHRQIGDLQYRIKRAKRADMACTAVLNSARDVLTSKRKIKQELLCEIKQNELEAAKSAKELERRKEQLNCSKSDREYETIKLQIEIEESKNNSLADLVLEKLEKIDEIELEIKKAEENFASAENDWKKQRETVLQKVAQLEAELLITTSRLREVEGRISGAWMTLYKRCVERFGGEEALASLVNELKCGSCNCQLPADVISKVRTGNAVCCPLCGRLLYLP